MDAITNITPTQSTDSLILGSGVILVICGLVMLLNIILFFKIWAMTNNVKDIKNALTEWFDIEHPIIEKDNEKSDSDKSP